MENHPKLIIIGLDGATFSVLNPLIKANLLPNLKKLFEKSAQRTLLSTIPPITALAWPTFFTGKNPGRHGLLSWQEPLNSDFKRPWISSKKIREPKIWHYLNAKGFQTCVANMPVTYPPEPLDGVMISGMLTPNIESEFTFPAKLKTEILANFPNFKTDIDVQQTKRHRYNHKERLQFLEEARNLTTIRGSSFRWLLAQQHPDVAIFVFELPDRLQHILWKQISYLPNAENSSSSAQEIRDSLIDCYQVMDEEIGKLLNNIPQSTYTISLSDHGFGPIHTNVHLNDWLAQQEFLNYSSLKAGGWNLLRQYGRRFKKWIPTSLVSKTKKAIPLYMAIDWSKTKAYSGLPSEYGVFLNCVDREPAGIVTKEAYESIRSQIIDALRKWKHPNSHERIMKQVYRREEIYSGNHLEHAPDIVFELQSGFYISDLTAPHQDSFFSDISFEDWGFHEREGIFTISGPGINQERNAELVNMEDLLPTILYALGIPIPTDLDGELIETAFLESWLHQHPIQFGKQQDFDNLVMQYDNRNAYTQSEEDIISERLKGLGYINE